MSDVEDEARARVALIDEIEARVRHEPGCHECDLFRRIIAALASRVSTPPSATVSAVNALLGVNLWDAPSFRADVRIDFDEHGAIRAAVVSAPPNSARMTSEDVRARIETARKVDGYESSIVLNGLVDRLADALEASAVSTPEARARAAEAVDRIGGWKHLRKYAGQTPAWMDKVRDAIVRAALSAVSTPPTITDAEREVIAAATEAADNSGPYRDTDGYMSVRVPNLDRVRAAVQALRAALGAALHPGGETNE